MQWQDQASVPLCTQVPLEPVPTPLGNHLSQSCFIWILRARVLECLKGHSRSAC